MPTDVERLTVLIESNTKSYERAMKKLAGDTQRALKASTASVDSLDRKLATVGATARRFAGIFGISLGVHAFAGLIKGGIEAGARIGDLANQLGITAEQVQEFSYAASQSGTSQESFVKAMTAMNRILGDARRGLTEGKREFQGLGISLDELEGKNPADVFELILAQINRLPDPLQRNAALLKFFGRSGLEMAEMVKIGAAGIDQLRQKARDAGLVLSGSDIAKLKQAGDHMSAMGSAAQAAGERIAVGFLPALEALDELMTSPEFQKGLKDTAETIGKIVKFLAENPGLATALIGAAAGGVVGGVPGALLGAAGGSALNLWRQLQGEQKDIPEITVRSGTGGGQSPLPGFDGLGEAADREREKIEGVVAALGFQRDQLGRTSREQFIYNQLNQAGIDANNAAAPAIIAAAGALYDQKEALDAAIERMDKLRATAKDVMGGFVDDLIAGKSAAEALGGVLDKLADKLLDLALDKTVARLFGAPGTAAGGILGGIASAFIPGLAGGGPVAAGRPYMVGERGPELFVPSMAGRINPGGGGGHVVVDLRLSDDIDGRIVRVAGPVAVKVTRAGIGANNSSVQRTQRLGA